MSVVFDKEALVISMSDVEPMSRALATKIVEQPDLVAFVAKGAYLIGQTLSNYYNVPLLEIQAERVGGGLKKKLHFILKILPKSINVFLRKFEMRLGIHSQSSRRNIKVSDPNGITAHRFNTILLVDDSIDTGNTIAGVKEHLSTIFPEAKIIVAAFDVFDASKSLVKTDYFLFENKIISGPWSADSKWNAEYDDCYKQLKNSGVF